MLFLYIDIELFRYYAIEVLESGKGSDAVPDIHYLI